MKIWPGIASSSYHSVVNFVPIPNTYIYNVVFMLFCVCGVLLSQVAGAATKNASIDTESIIWLEERSVRWTIRANTEGSLSFR